MCIRDSAEHRPAAVDDLTLGVLLGAEGDDGGLAAAGVGAELGVDVGLDDLGNRLGLKRGERRASSSSVACFRRQIRARENEQLPEISGRIRMSSTASCVARG